MHIIVTGKAVKDILLFVGGLGCGVLFSILGQAVHSAHKGKS